MYLYDKLWSVTEVQRCPPSRWPEVASWGEKSEQTCTGTELTNRMCYCTFKNMDSLYTARCGKTVLCSSLIIPRFQMYHFQISRLFIYRESNHRGTLTFNSKSIQFPLTGGGCSWLHSFLGFYIWILWWIFASHFIFLICFADVLIYWNSPT